MSMADWIGQRIRVRTSGGEKVDRAYEYGGGLGLKLGECYHAETGEWLAAGRVLPWKASMEAICLGSPFEFSAIVRRSKKNPNYFVFAESSDFS
jgi:hypothetical protein